MNRLVFLLPSEHVVYNDVPAGEVCDTLIGIARFLDHEQCALYWDEKAYKALRGSIAGSDKTSLGLRRVRLQKFTHYEYLPGNKEGLRAYSSDTEISENILGRYALCKYSHPDEHTAAVSTRKKIGRIDVYEEHRRVYSCDAADICDIPSAVSWFAENRSPQRVFNFQYPKHNVRGTYMVDGMEVSPLTGTSSQINSRLRHAIGIEHGDRLMCYEEDSDILFIFSFENRTDRHGQPIYHGHQIARKRKADINRLPPAYLKKIKVLTGIDIRI